MIRRKVRTGHRDGQVDNGYYKINPTSGRAIIMKEELQ
jgi:hypothetical protein